MMMIMLPFQTDVVRYSLATDKRHTATSPAFRRMKGENGHEGFLAHRGFLRLTSAVITTLGLMVGLHSGTHSKMIVLSGIFTIAIADAFSDALGIHISKEFENAHTVKQIWGATIATFMAKFLFAMTFVVPVFFLSLSLAIIVSVAWGFLILTCLTYFMARAKAEPAWRIIGEHVLIAGVVVVITHWVGDWIGTMAQ
jgi:VIT1/CCC1 family predicted Fe2+/Mn2+ transporter